jgi:photosystem II stability/assembly factor-like uncharacterized protein
MKRGLLTLAAVVVLSGMAWAGQADIQKGEFQVMGMGGAGGIYTPSINPEDSNIMLVTSDMSGVYRSTDAGKSWDMINCRQIYSSRASRPGYAKGVVYWCTGAILKVSKDKGKTWSQVVTGQAPWTEITDIAASDAGAIVVGSKSGVWACPSGDGQTWEKVVDRPAVKPGDIVGTRAIVLDGVFYAVGNNKIMQSKGGKTWEEIDVAPAGENMILGIAGASVGGKVTLMALVKAVGILRSEDGGKTWVNVRPWDPQVAMCDLIMSPKNSQVVLTNNKPLKNEKGKTQELLMSADGGKTWKTIFNMGSNVEKSWVQTILHWGFDIGELSIAIDPNNAETVLVSTQGDFYRSTDGGASWKPLMNQPMGAAGNDPGLRWKTIGLEVTSVWGYVFDPKDINRQYICYTDVGFARSTDGGETFISASQGCPWSNTFYEIAFDPFVPGKIYAACSSRHDIPHWGFVSPNGKGRSMGGICVSDNYAQDWKVLNKDVPTVPCTGIIVDPKSTKDSLIMYATFYEDGVYKTTDGGKTWVKKSKGLGHPENMHVLRVKIAPKSGNLYCVETAMRRGDANFPVPGGLWKSTDGGESWTNLIDTLHWPTDVAIDPTNEDIMYLTACTIPGGPEGGLYKTIDGGKTWQQVISDKDTAVWGAPNYFHGMVVKLHPDDPNTVYFGAAGHGLGVSKDGGKTWEQFKKLPFHGAQNMAFLPTDHNIIYVTTFGGGIWKGLANPKND